MSTRRTYALAGGLVLIVLAFAVPPAFDWSVRSTLTEATSAPPLSAHWMPRVNLVSLISLLLAAVAVRCSFRWAQRWSWRTVLAGTYLTAIGWMFSLALIDGLDALTRVTGRDSEYLVTAREVAGISAMLRQYIDRIPYDAVDNWPTHVAGHPPGAILNFIALDRLGLGGNLVAAIILVLLGATSVVAVLLTLRRLGVEEAARRSAPFLALAPAAVWMAVSADALFTAFAAWGITALAYAATAPSTKALTLWSIMAGLLLGWCVLCSYGLPLLGVIGIGVLAAAARMDAIASKRAWLPLPISAATASALVLGFAFGGFSLWAAFPVLHERYNAGIASDRPLSYWFWANLALLLLSAGPALAPALASLGWRNRAVTLIAASAAAAITLANLSGMSKAEVERIWLPFVPWLLVATAALPDRWRRPMLITQVGTALLVQHLVKTSW